MRSFREVRKKDFYRHLHWFPRSLMKVSNPKSEVILWKEKQKNGEDEREREREIGKGRGKECNMEIMVLRLQPTFFSYSSCTSLICVFCLEQ